MLNTTMEQPLKDLVYNCQAYLHWYDEYKADELWDAQKKCNDFLQRIRKLVPQCLNLIKHDVSVLDCE